MKLVQTKSKWKFSAIMTLIATIFVAGFFVINYHNQSAILSQMPWRETVAKLEFPKVDETKLASQQVKTLNILKTEYAAQNPGTKYSEGIDEPWCADFVSWVLRESGRPLTNPNSGSWRIPGVATLQEHFSEQGIFHNLGKYLPKPGNVVIYKNGSFGQHTNFVVAVDRDEITTVGGNENDKILLQKFNPNNEKFGVVGFANL